jgi:hypothetical protein
MSIIGEGADFLKSLVSLFAIDNTKPKNYDDACRIARKNAELDVLRLRIKFDKEQMNMYPREAYGKEMKDKKEEIDKLEEEKYKEHLNNILKLYGIEETKT